MIARILLLVVAGFIGWLAIHELGVSAGIFDRAVEDPLPVVVSLLLLATALFLGFVGIAPFFRRPTHPSPAELRDAPIEEMLQSLFPLLAIGERIGGRSPLLPPAGKAGPEVVLLKMNGEDTSRRAVLAVLTNRRYLLYRTRRQWLQILLSATKNLIGKAPFGDMMLILLKPFGETREMLFAPEDRRLRKVMARSDSELLSGAVPWRKASDLTIAQVVERTESVSLKPTFWSRGYKIEFMPRTFRDLLKMPPDLVVREECIELVLSRLVGFFEPDLIEAGCPIKRDEDRIMIDFRSAGAFSAG